ncbi:MAG: DUF3883 domain-containing protein [Cyanobacteria bacterium]|nr:DUF3883 domain-containing protein [Cyanobacteria bacterium CG_2015-16_32_12]NCO79289.1 DUF3883 domain-containing protein [Cyanobacteria bacterium CG_2015-22_32_23]NCQ05396.1 DUF3883 domain-containing protein [Cyanobacteria bacterium CG_2015-09_32_10]NCQ41653.1 DUF3883 domain-containing protein [Cyanobacteria bacterium CG_2015-04_32_10]NCS85602.1 DUF3883 domain-containing protein [Cyanobacteria bacterium CG_2015-02_32_10]
MGKKHENYEILNLIGYGLSKFNHDFIKEFGFETKTAFYQYCISVGICKTVGIVKNRMDLFDYFFPDNGRKGWWQKGDAYIHRKIQIDSLFGDADVISYANIIKLYLKENFKIQDLSLKENPLIKSKFKQLQMTGLEAELYFLNNFKSLDLFREGKIEDARLYGDGYDFQINVNNNFFLIEVKGIREKKGKFRLTENEYQKVKEYQNQYILSAILNLNEIPIIKLIENHIHNLDFKKVSVQQKIKVEYHLCNPIFIETF